LNASLCDVLVPDESDAFDPDVDESEVFVPSDCEDEADCE
jgi:hypothetical protein